MGRNTRGDVRAKEHPCFYKGEREPKEEHLGFVLGGIGGRRRRG